MERGNMETDAQVMPVSQLAVGAQGRGARRHGVAHSKPRLVAFCVVLLWVTAAGLFYAAIDLLQHGSESGAPFILGLLSYLMMRLASGLWNLRRWARTAMMVGLCGLMACVLAITIYALDGAGVSAVGLLLILPVYSLLASVPTCFLIWFLLHNQAFS
jgi:hypothetical protein